MCPPPHPPPPPDRPVREVDVVVVGGGIAGLSAAWELRDTDLLVLEAESRVGGRLLSQARDRYWLNFGGHVLSGPESATGRLLRSVGVVARDLPGVLTALALGDRVLSGRRVEAYPLQLGLERAERLALIRAGARLRLAVERYRRATARRPAEPTADHRRRVLGYDDGRSFADFLGAVPPRVDAIFRATIRRSSGEPEHVAAGYGIGYFQLVWDRVGGLTRNIVGGSGVLPQAIAECLGDSVVTGARVTRITSEDDRVRVRFDGPGGPQEVVARFAVVATPADETRRLVAGLPPETEQALGAIRYGPYVVGAFLTAETEPMPYDHVYAIATPERSFNMMFNTANLLRTGPGRAPGGTLMVYSGAELARRVGELDDEHVRDRYVDDLVTLFPQLRGRISEAQIRRWPRGLPHPTPGRSAAQPGLERSLGRVYLAGDYLGTTYVETAVETGTTAAHEIRRRLRERLAGHTP